MLGEALFQMSPIKLRVQMDSRQCFIKRIGMWWVKSCLLLSLKCFSTGSLSRLCNKTLIVLISKTPSPTKLNNYRPISLCNVSYKLVTKVIVNRLKDILSSLISPTQSSFVPKRQITDNVVIVKEILHSISQKRSGRGLQG